MKRLIFACLLATLTFTAAADPPASSGIVERAGYPVFWFYRDFNSGLTAVFGQDPVEACSVGAGLDVVYYSDKILQGGLRLSTLGKGELTTSVWDTVEPVDCTYFLSTLPLAAGLSQVRMFDNDLFLLSNCELNNMNAFSRAAHGTLYSPYGEKVQFQFIRQEMYDCRTDTYTLLVNRISLR